MVAALVALALFAPRALTLEDAVAIAQKQNSGVQVARAEAARAETVNHQAMSLFLPQVDARSTMQWNDKKISYPGFTAGSEFVLQPWWTLSWQVTASQNLSLYGPGLPLLRQAHAATRAAGALSSEAKLEAGFATARAYYAALEADSLSQLAEQSRGAANEMLRQTQGRRDAGRATEAEALRAKLRVAESAQAAATAKRAAEEARETLADLLGERGPFVLSRPERPAAPASVADEPATLARRPDVAAAREAVTGATDARLAAARQYYPTLTVTGLYSGYTTSDGTLFGQAPSRLAVLGVATVPIFDGNLKYWQLREKREAVHAAEARAGATQAAAAADLRRASRKVDAAREAETLSHERLALAERTRELVSGQYSLGAATQLELLDADAAQSAVRREASQAELEADLAVLDLRRAMGLPITEARP